jgi:hypothetical protein
MTITAKEKMKIIGQLVNMATVAIRQNEDGIMEALDRAIDQADDGKRGKLGVGLLLTVADAGGGRFGIKRKISYGTKKTEADESLIVPGPDMFEGQANG